MTMVFKDNLFDSQWLRAASHASSGGGDVGECFAAAREMGEPDAERWFSAWSKLADAVLADAVLSAAQNRPVSARAAYLRASNYYRAAYTFLIGTPVDQRVVGTYRLQREAFQSAVTLMSPTAERVSIPYEGGALHGYLFRASDDGQPRPTLIINGGYDSTAEEAFFFSGAAAVARGYNCFVFDGPGQGSAIIEDAVVFRPDWENVITPVINFAIAYPEVDPARIALMGISFGGYLAPRGVSAEHRIAACIADPGEASLFDEMKSRMPGFITRELPHGNPLVLSLLGFMLRRRMRHVTGGWGLRRGLWVHGVTDPLDYLRLTQDYSLGERAAQIRCPMLVCSAENDDIGITADALYDALTCPKTRLKFSTEFGAGEHCESGARSLFNQKVFDWLDEVLANLEPPRRDQANTIRG